MRNRISKEMIDQDFVGQVEGFSQQLADKADWISAASFSGLTDADKIQAAINAAPEDGTVYIPNKNYVITKSIVIQGKKRFKLINFGTMRVQTNEPAMILDSCTNCLVEGLDFRGVSGFSGVGLQVKGLSTNNRIRKTTGWALKNYIFEVLNDGLEKNPASNTIENVENFASHGVLKDVSTVPNKPGYEISIANVRNRTNLDTDNTQDRTPALFWLRNIHDVQISNVSGEHKWTMILLEGDTNSHLSQIYASSYKDSTVKIQRDPENGYGVAITQMDEIFLWGIPASHGEYVPNYGLDISDVKLLNATNVQITNYDKAGLRQGRNGYFNYSDITFQDNLKDVEFVNQTVFNTFVAFNTLTTNHDKKGDTVFYADCTNTDLNNMWNTDCKINDSRLQGDKIFNFITGENTYIDAPSFACYNCAFLGNYTLSGIGRIFPSFAAGPPTTGKHRKGQIVYNNSPASGGHIGWVCVLAGTPGTWKGFGLIQE